MITRLNFFSAKPGNGGKLGGLLAGVVRDVENLPGCSACRVVQSAANPAQFVVIEDWASSEAHESAVQSISQDTFRAVLALLDGAPEGDYYQRLRSAVRRGGTARPPVES